MLLALQSHNLRATQRIDPVDVQPACPATIALAARQYLGAAGVIAEQCDGLVKDAWTPIEKRTGLHCDNLALAKVQPGTNAVTIAGMMKISAIINIVSQT